MAEAEDNGNGKITLALIGQKLDTLSRSTDEFRQEMTKTVAMLCEAKTRHDQQSETHCHELYNNGRSRIQTVEAAVQSNDEKLHVFMRETTERFDQSAERAKVGQAKQWDTWKIVMAVVLGLIANQGVQWAITHYGSK